MSAAALLRAGLVEWSWAGRARILEEQLCDLKHVAWTVELQTMHGTGFELPEKTFLQSSQQAGPLGSEVEV